MSFVSLQAGVCMSSYKEQPVYTARFVSMKAREYKYWYQEQPGCWQEHRAGSRRLEARPGQWPPCCAVGPACPAAPLPAAPPSPPYWPLLHRAPCCEQHQLEVSTALRTPSGLFLDLLKAFTGPVSGHFQGSLRVVSRPCQGCFYRTCFRSCSGLFQDCSARFMQ